MRRNSLLVIFLIVFIDLVGFGIVIPILPLYAKSYGANGWKLGWLMTSYSLMQFIFAPIWGKISDRFGRRPVLMTTIFGNACSMVLLGLAGSLKWLFIGRTLAGICAANISTAYAYVSDVTPPNERAKGMGMIGAGFGLGFIFGPIIGGILDPYGHAIPMFAGALLSFFNLIFAAYALEEPNLRPEVREQNRSKRDLDSIRTAFGDSRTRMAIGLFFLVTFAVAQMESVFAIYMDARYEYGTKQVAFIFALMGVIMVSVQGYFIRKLAPKYGEKNLILFGTALCAVSLAGFASVGSIPLVVLLMSFMAFGHGMLHPSLSSLASLGSSNQKHGATMGVFHSAGSLARVVAPPIAGWLFDRISWRSPFYWGSLVLLLAFVVAGMEKFVSTQRAGVLKQRI